MLPSDGSSVRKRLARPALPFYAVCRFPPRRSTLQRAWPRQGVPRFTCYRARRRRSRDQSDRRPAAQANDLCANFVVHEALTVRRLTMSVPVEPNGKVITTKAGLQGDALEASIERHLPR